MKKKTDTYHIPVMFEESLDYLIGDENGIYIDGTAGGGGHTSGILGRLGKWGHLYSFDKDPDAIEHCTARFASELALPEPRLTILNMGFEKAYSIMSDERRLNGILLDLGVSSHQLDSAGRGISHRFESLLDMRFGSEGKTASQLMHAASEEELVRILSEYGEEPFARPLARRIVMRRAFSLEKSSELVDIVKDTVPGHLINKTLARVFQAFRIAVNDELIVLGDTIRNIMPVLDSGGHCVVISYHSLEDRIVKNVFREFVGKKEHKNKYAKDYKQVEYEQISSKPLLPSKEEIGENRRARSAKMRVIKRNYIAD